MATIIWENISTPVSNWTTAADWQGGVVPGPADTAKISIGGGSEPTYEVDITTAIDVAAIVQASDISFLNESSAGSITTATLDLDHGILALNAVNAITHAHINSIAEFSVDGAFGTNTIFANDGFLYGTTNLSLSNAVSFTDITGFDAAAGDTVKYLGSLTATSNGPTIEFGSIGLGATGTVEIAGTSYTRDGGTAGSIIDVTAGTVISGTGAHSGAADAMFSDAGHVTINGGATLDVGHFGTAVTLTDLSGTGTVKDSSDAVTITLSGADFAGDISGNSKLDISGTNALGGDVGNTSIAMDAASSLDLTAATGHYTITSAGAGSTLDIGSGTVNHVDGFNSGNLTIDTTFDQHDLVVFKTGSGYEQAVIHPGHGAATTSVYFFGLTSSDGINVGNDGDGHLQFTFGAGEAHAAMHTAAIEHAAADAAFVPTVHDWI